MEVAFDPARDLTRPLLYSKTRDRMAAFPPQALSNHWME
jgi:hypothetical protein